MCVCFVALSWYWFLNEIWNEIVRTTKVRWIETRPNTEPMVFVLLPRQLARSTSMHGRNRPRHFCGSLLRTRLGHVNISGEIVYAGFDTETLALLSRQSQNTLKLECQERCQLPPATGPHVKFDFRTDCIFSLIFAFPPPKRTLRNLPASWLSKQIDMYVVVRAGDHIVKYEGTDLKVNRLYG